MVNAAAVLLRACRLYIYRTQGPVIHVETSLPKNSVFIEIKFIALIEMIVYHREQIIGGSYRVNVSVKCRLMSSSIGTT